MAAGFRDVQPPVVSLVEPLAGSVKGPMDVIAEATDNGQIDRVEFFVGNGFWKDAVAPYGSMLPVPTALYAGRPGDDQGDRVRQGRQLRDDVRRGHLRQHGPARQRVGPGP